MGGRMCTMAAAGGEDIGDALPVAGLIAICYPLHPPGKPDNLRVAHLPRITVPCLFISGTRDAFGTPDELESATGAISGPVTHVWIERGNHTLDRVDDRIVDAVRAWIRTNFTL